MLLMIALSAAALLSACGGGGGGGGSEVTPPPPPADGPDLLLLVTPAGNPVPSGVAQTMATVKLSNVGKGAATTTDVNINADAILQDLKVVNCKSDNPASACPATGSRMTVSNLLPGASLTFEVTGMVKLGTSSTVNVEASASTGSGTQLSSSKMSVGFKAYSVDVGVQATGPTSAVPEGSSFDYVVTVSNKGPDIAKDTSLGLALLSNPVPNAPTLGSISCSATGAAVCPTELKIGVMTLPSLPKDGTLVFTLPYRFAPGVTAGLVFNAGVRATGDVDASNDSALILTPSN
ncbi:COG1361 family protein [Roseateles oligotrophus]|nr:hypothetical protein [Roseateles oligotrophus]